MKAAVLTDAYKIEIKNIDRPPVGKNDVLIRVKSTGICGSDLYVYRGVHPFRSPPAILGHELSGVVEEIGKEVQHIKVGDRVAVEPGVGCGVCASCLEHKYNICENKRGPGLVPEWDGSFAEYFIAPEQCVYTLPDDLGFAAGALMEPLAVAVHAIKKAELELGDTVAILGGGTIGLLCLMVARKAGASQILVTDTFEYNLEVAKQLGAQIVVNVEKDNAKSKIEAESENGHDKVIIAAGIPSAWADAVRLSQRGGKIAIVGMIKEPVEVDFLDLIRQEKSLCTSWNFVREDFETAIRMAREMEIERIITHRFDLDKTAEALDLMDKKPEEVIKIILNPGKER